MQEQPEGVSHGRVGTAQCPLGAAERAAWGGGWVTDSPQILIAKCHDGTAYQVGPPTRKCRPPTTRRALRRLALAPKQGLDRLGQQYEGVCNV